MPTSERSPVSSAFGEITPYDPTKVAGYSKLVERLGPQPETMTTDALDGDYVDTGESSPIFDDLVENGLESSDEPAESVVDASSSRLAELLRRGANGADAAAERWDDTKDRAKKKLRLFGRSALRAATATGEFTLGAGVLAANKGLELADRADAAVISAAESAKNNVKDAYNTAADKTGEAIMNGLANVEAGMDKVGDKLVGFKDGVKEKLIARKAAALARRQARRDRWSQRIAGAKESLNNGLDRSAELAMAAGAKLEQGMDAVGTKMVNAQEAATDKIERTRTSVRTTRAAGRAALDAFRATQAAAQAERTNV